MNGGEVEYKNELYNDWNIATTPTWDWVSTDFRIKQQKKIVTIEKWLCTNEFGDYFAVELGKNNIGVCKKVKLIESYEVEL